MIQITDNYYELHTNSTTYAFRVLESGQLEHLYYGRRIRSAVGGVLEEKHSFPDGNTVIYDPAYPALSLENQRLEISSRGKGDVRESFMELVYADGSRTSDFVFSSAETYAGKEALTSLPSSYGTEDQVETLKVTLTDKNSDLVLELYYHVYESCDVISRSALLRNQGQETVTIEKLLSMQLDFDDDNWIFTSFHGAWAREMDRYDQRVQGGKIVNSSNMGTSSSRANPFVMISRENTTEEAGEVYGLNLIYSGNHYEAAESSAFHKLRYVSGINPEGFSWKLEPGTCFETPEAVFTYAHNGHSQMSQHMHDFVRNHVVRGEWKSKERPILLNSWEAAYFKINEKNLLKLADTAAKCGMELFVMDDGWFGCRDNDTCSLGDWSVNKSKLPGGLEGLAKKVTDKGIAFGIWVEPEMVNVDSDLYRAHPDWAIDIPGKAHSESRNQRILDLVNPEVCEYIIESMSRVFSTPNLSYVKWDMNRIFSDVYSKALPADRQGEVAHRYMMGLYRVMATLTEKFPHILFEGCAAGGNRFDLGILSYFPQIWASDNTDALCRVRMMTNYSYGYPMCCVSAHVSAVPNHQTLRLTPLNTRFNVAAFGVAGYECNLGDMSKEELEAIKGQVETLKKWRGILQLGRFYRGRKGQVHEWTAVSRDGKKAVGMIMQELVEPNSAFEQFFPRGLNPEARYHFYNVAMKQDIHNFGDLINTASPIHIKDGSLAQDLIAKFYKMDGEQEDLEAFGDTLMYGGVKLHPAFAATGYDGSVRYFQDFSSRMYFMEEL